MNAMKAGWATSVVFLYALLTVSTALVWRLTPVSAMRAGQEAFVMNLFVRSVKTEPAKDLSCVSALKVGKAKGATCLTAHLPV